MERITFVSMRYDTRNDLADRHGECFLNGKGTMKHKNRQGQSDYEGKKGTRRRGFQCGEQGHYLDAIKLRDVALDVHATSTARNLTHPVPV